MKFPSLGAFPLSIIFFISILYGLDSASASSPSSYSKVKIEKLNLNRSAKPLSSFQKQKFAYSHTGFNWNDGDNNTKKWRPQGIAGIATGEKKYIAVTWYGRSQAKFQAVSYTHLTLPTKA